jgi:FkbM family methyltransferase
MISSRAGNGACPARRLSRPRPWGAATAKVSGGDLISRPSVVSLLNHVPAPVARLFATDSRASRLLRPLVNCLAPEGQTWVEVRSGPAQGISLLIDAKKEKYLWTGQHEPAVQRAMTALLRPGMTFWDVGAHLGFFTLLAARLVGCTGHVHAFEPVEQNRQQLMAAVDRNGCANVVIHALAFSSTAGQALLHAHESSAMWSLAGEGEDGVRVQYETLDSVELPAPDLVKIDVEGAELDVLRGGRKLLVEARPALVVEFTTNALVEEARRLLPGYHFEHLDGEHWSLRTA